ncbi:hypothetical protein GCM10010185_17370 [Saccharothrix coeruleofusca]|uniref:Uncharacterized protein n=1 Tax=Saccharothrix coeruleofusca TaxID=33919 RepID=A0A918AMG0_9PSEU|nr:hypothetical protein GCM10010185_17370 [Saccharothrix coeruleofusca]
MKKPGEDPAEVAAQPLCTEEEFAHIMRVMAEDQAPRLFAIVEEHGERAGGRVAGYGLAYGDRVEVNSVEGGFHLISRSAERACQLFEISAGARGARTHLVWLRTGGTRPVRSRAARRSPAPRSGCPGPPPASAPGA